MSIGRLALLVFASGGCALVYQSAWLRLLRLVFGSSTAASAAVLAIFMGGLGLGGLILGRRADASRNPLRLYAQLELGVSLAAAASPILIALVQGGYVAMGGSLSLGLFGGTVIRLVLSAVVLGVPAFLMGGTLPALARAVESDADARRAHLGVLYGTNTLGAVAGTMWTTFVSLELLGARATIWSASALNLAVASAAFALARNLRANKRTDSPPPKRAKRAEAPAPITAPVTNPLVPAPAWLVITAAGAAGFAFFVMELVWYRMLTPLLGGSSYTFGLILAVALLGIGLGGLGYGVVARQRRPTAAAFALTCAIEAACIAIPYALGDQIALFALAQRQNMASFAGLVWGWVLVASAVVLPAAAVSGYQFPLLVGLLGSGDRDVGAEVGRVYASNSLGAIVGSLAAGFGLLPLLTAPGLWRVVVYLLLALCGVTIAAAIRASQSRRLLVATVAVAAAALSACFATGPTAFWRHSAIGAGRARVTLSDPNDVRRVLNKRQLEVLWEVEGIESSVSLDRADGLSFYVNGKSDGNVLGDAPTQVMLGLVGAILHPNPTRALVIGLGTGETAGWLAQVPSIEAVDVFELEPSVIRVAEACAAVNHNALANPKVRVIVGDARELLLTTSAQYDLIVSEPSNPYRAGTASLFTREFYAAVAGRLRPAGIFMQWVQAYEISQDALRSIYATLGAVFPAVETWESVLARDFSFLAAKETLVHDVSRVRARTESEPYRSALAAVWGIGGAEGLYTGFVGNASFATAFRSNNAPVNTDDLTVLEFEFARSVGQSTLVSVSTTVHNGAASSGYGQPVLVNGSIDWEIVAERLAARAIAEDGRPAPVIVDDPAVRARQQARQAYAAANMSEARQRWFEQAEAPTVLGDVRLVAEALASTADPRAEAAIEALRAWEPVEAESLLTTWYREKRDAAAAVDHLIKALNLYGSHPWTNRALFSRAFNATTTILERDPPKAARVFDALTEPFAVRALDIARLRARVSIGLHPDLGSLCVAGLAPLEPHVIWEEDLLRRRVGCYATTRNPMVADAREDLEAFLAAARPNR